MKIDILIVWVMLCAVFSFPLSAEESSGPDSSGTEAVSGPTIDGVFLGTVIDRELLDRLPNSDDITEAFSLFGGITGTTNLHVHGGPINANLFMIDGVNMTDPLTGIGSIRINSDVVDHVEIGTGGLGARWGYPLGGLFNVVTKSGTNQFHGTFRIHYTDESWHDSPDHDVWFGDDRYFSPTMTLSGPIWKDRIWFLVSFQRYDIENTERIARYFGTGSGSAGNTRSIDTDEHFESPFLKLDWQPADTHHLSLEFNQSTITNENTGATLDSLPDSLTDMRSDMRLFRVGWTWRISDRFVLNSRIGLAGTALDILPKHRSNDPRMAAFFDMYTGLRYNNSSDWIEDSRERLEMRISAVYELESAWGVHRLEAGVQREAISYENIYRYPGGASYTVQTIPAGDPADPDHYFGMDAFRCRLIHPASQESACDTTSGYLQDDWKLTDTISMNLGLRYESSVFSVDGGSEYAPAWKWGWFDAGDYLAADGTHLHRAEMAFESMLAPRIGLSWDLRNDGFLVLNAHYGRHYNPFDLSIAAQFQPFESDNYAQVCEDYTGPGWTDSDRDGVPDEDFFFDDTNWEETSRDTPSDSNLLDPDIEPEYSDQYQIGLDMELTPELGCGVTLLYNRTNDMIEDVGLFTDDEGNIVWTYRGGITGGELDPGKRYDPIEYKTYSKHLYWITNAQGAVREYRGLELNAAYHDTRFDVLASYTLSESQAAILDQPPGESGIAQFSGQFDTYAISRHLFGETPWSARHYVKVAGAVHQKLTSWYEASLGVNAFWRSGYHYSKRTTPPPTFDPDDPENDPDDPSTWTGRPPYRSYAMYYPEGRGTYELPSVYSIDLSVQNTFDFSKFGTVTLIFDILNATDFQGPLSQVDIYIPAMPERFGTEESWVAPRSYRLGLKYAF